MNDDALNKVTHPKPPGTLLAGGLSRRLGGGDKPLREIGGRSILDRAIARLAPQCDALVLNANGDTARFAPFSLPVIADSIGNFAGPLAGILAGMDWAAEHRPDAQWIVTAAADTPFLPRDLVARLQAKLRDNEARIVVAASNGRSHHVTALWSMTLRDDLRRALARDQISRVSEWIARYRFAVAEWPSAPFDPFFNVNTPDDLASAQSIATLDDAGTEQERQHRLG